MTHPLGARPLLGFVLFSAPVTPEAAAQALAADPAITDALVARDEQLHVAVGEITVLVQLVDRPVPDGEAAANLHPMMAADRAAIEGHTAQAIVSTMAYDDTRLPEDRTEALRALQLAQSAAVRALLTLPEAVGYYNGVAATTFGAETAREELAGDGETAVMVWAPTWLFTDGDIIRAYTYGLSWFGHPELQAQVTGVEWQDVLTALLTLSDAVTHGTVLEPGATFTPDGGPTLTAKAAPWLVDGSTRAIQLEFPR